MACCRQPGTQHTWLGRRRRYSQDTREMGHQRNTGSHATGSQLRHSGTAVTQLGRSRGLAPWLTRYPTAQPSSRAQALPHIALPAAVSAVRTQFAPPLVTKPRNPLPPSSRGVNSESPRHAVHVTAALPAVQLLPSRCGRMASNNQCMGSLTTRSCGIGWLR